MPRGYYQFLLSNGFRADEEKGVLKLRLKLTGKRYLPRYDLGTRIPRLSKNYIIPVYYEGNTFDKITQAALTPITVAADATILIGKTVLLPFTN